MGNCANDCARYCGKDGREHGEFTMDVIILYLIDKNNLDTKAVCSESAEVYYGHSITRG